MRIFILCNLCLACSLAGHLNGQSKIEWETENGSKVVIAVTQTTSKAKCDKSSSVVIKTFQVERTKTKVNLLWETIREVNNRGFEIQRRSGERDWERVAFVFPQTRDGNSDVKLTYEYTDVNIEKEVTQYRLRQVVKSENYTYSEVLTILGFAIRQ